MRYKRRNVEIVSDVDVIRNIITNRGAFTPWVGAGASIEAGVSTAQEICKEIRAEIVRFENPIKEDEWANEELEWDDLRRRYSACLLRYARTPVQRLQYFRRLIQGVQPSFSHHALCLLMSAEVVQGTCLTTNFDKLIEMAFAQQGFSECQSIRSEKEAEYWRQEAGKCYVVKLHGDYETYNIQNTRDETIFIAGSVRKIVMDLVKHGGLFFIGSSGYEQSVTSLMNELLSSESIPNMGVYWGVRVTGARPARLSPLDIEKLIAQSLDAGSVNEEIVEILARAHSEERPCAFFPVWSSGAFFFDLIQRTENRAVVGRSRQYLDHFMRLRQVFVEGGMTETAIENRLAKFQPVTRQLPEDLHQRAHPVKTALTARSSACGLSIRLLYGDVTSRSLMADGDFGRARRAVISPDDTFISAAGGAALALLMKAGSHMILNEIAKFPQVSQGDIVITSGGNLPVNYIYHSAATRLDPDGSSHISPEDISTTVGNALELAIVHGVSVVFSPLIGAGTEGMKPSHSLGAILEAAARLAKKSPAVSLILVVVALDEGVLSKADACVCFGHALGGDWVLDA
jgi:O-acetyl-ADP-ribose deacetylase (regulator of RNase III)